MLHIEGISLDVKLYAYVAQEYLTREEDLMSDKNSCQQLLEKASFSCKFTMNNPYKIFVEPFQCWSHFKNFICSFCSYGYYDEVWPVLFKVCIIGPKYNHNISREMNGNRLKNIR
jgi:hypothetical protein